MECQQHRFYDITVLVLVHSTNITTLTPVLSGHSKRRPKTGFQDRLSLNADQRYCRMLRGEHSAKLSTFIKPPFVIKIIVCLFLSGRFTQVLLYYLSLFNLFFLLFDKLRGYATDVLLSTT